MVFIIILLIIVFTLSLTYTSNDRVFKSDDEGEKE